MTTPRNSDIYSKLVKLWNFRFKLFTLFLPFTMNVSVCLFVVVFVFNIPPWAKVIRRGSQALKSHQTDWDYWSQESILRRLVYKASGLSTTPLRLQLADFMMYFGNLYCKHYGPRLDQSALGAVWSGFIVLASMIKVVSSAFKYMQQM